MKAIVVRELGGPDVLRFEDVPDPVAGPGEVLIEVHAVSVNRTLDLAVREGTYVFKPALPHILGVDPTGIISALGAGVTDRKVGDRVAVLPWRAGPEGPLQFVGLHRPGGYAQLITVAASATVVLPASLDFPTATLVVRHGPQAYFLLRERAQLKAGETVLVMGASGGLASAGAQIARAMGARVIVAAGSVERVNAALQLGADAGINYRAMDLTEEALRLTAGRGVDVVFENIGDPVQFPRALRALARQGRLVTAGSHATGDVVLDVKRVYLYQLSILGGLGSRPADLQDSLRLAADGHFRVLIDRVMPLREAAQAHRLVTERSGIGKVILEPVSA
jgi:NADPH:quinone reductase-like Zn-dependent oxidoreductase